MWASEVLSNLLIHYNAIMRLSSLKLGITTQQSLNLIAIPYDGIPMSLLAKKMGLDASTLTRNINNLEKLQFVKRIRDQQDKRVQKILLTSRGSHVVKQLDIKLEKINQYLLNSMDIDDHEKSINAIESLSWHLKCFREQ